MVNSKWEVSEVNALLTDIDTLPFGNHEISILKLDLETKTVIGKDKDGYLVFGAPQYSEFEGYEFDRAKLESNKSIFVSNGVSIQPVFTLRFLTNSADETAAIATIFVGLQNQIVESGNSISAQEAALGLESYFSGLGKLQLSRQVQIGLFGELAFIYSSTKKAEMINAWHSSPRSTYDFGIAQGRLEVKTSTAPTRLHWLRNTQSVDLDSEKLTYLSLYAPEVGDGLTLHELVTQLKIELEQQEISVLMNKLALYEIEKADLRFDLNSAISSFKFVRSSEVPRVSSEEAAVVQIAWRCDFARLPGERRHDFWS